MPSMPKGQREQALLLVCIVAFAAIGLYWYLVFTPRAAELAKESARVEQLVALNDRAKAELARGDLATLRAQLASYQEHLSLIRTLVPAGNEVPALLEQISTAARRVDLDVATVDPQPVADGDNYDTYRYGMSVVGGYHQIAEFFTNVGSLNRIVLPVNVTLQISTNPNAVAAAKPNAAAIEARFQLQTFVTHKSSPDDQTLPPDAKGAKS